MQLYRADVKIGRSEIGPYKTHVLAKEELTAAEIMVLRFIHGDDSVVNVKRTRMDKRAHAAEWDRLEKLYASDKGNPAVSVFGPAGASRLPVDLPEAAPEEVEEKAKA